MRLIPFFAVDNMWRALRTHISSVTRVTPQPSPASEACRPAVDVLFVMDPAGVNVCVCVCVCVYGRLHRRLQTPIVGETSTDVPLILT
jgi:hypothetical protein